MALTSPFAQDAKRRAAEYVRSKVVRMNSRLGSVARRIRLEHQLNLLDVSQLAGVSQATISRFERGTGWPEQTDAIVAAYALACNLTPEYIWRLALEENEEDA